LLEQSKEWSGTIGLAGFFSGTGGIGFDALVAFVDDDDGAFLASVVLGAATPTPLLGNGTGVAAITTGESRSNGRVSVAPIGLDAIGTTAGRGTCVDVGTEAAAAAAAVGVVTGDVDDATSFVDTIAAATTPLFDDGAGTSIETTALP
jgi:hypothetical protein